MMTKTLPNPALEGYRTAHEQNTDGTYRNIVTHADIFPQKGKNSGVSAPISESVCPDKYGQYEPVVIQPKPERISVTPSGVNHAARDFQDQMTEIGARRLISKRMAQAYRLRHQDHYGLSTEVTARLMGITCEAVRKLLWEMCKIAPNLFPIITVKQARAWHLWHNEGMSFNMIAEVMGISVNAAHKCVSRTKKRLDYHESLKHRLIVMDPFKLDRLVVEAKF